MKRIFRITLFSILLLGTINTSISAKDLGFGLQIGGGLTIPRENNTITEDKGFLGNGKYCFSFIPYLEYVYEDFYIGARIAIKYNLFAFDIDVINKDSSNDPKPKTTFNLKQHYVSVPILFQLNPVEPLSINIGPELFFRISHTFNVEKKDKGGLEKIEDRSYKNFVFGMLLNIEYEYMGVNFGLESGMTFTGIDEYKNENEKNNKKEDFEKNKKEFESSNIFYLIFKVGYNFAHILKNESH